MIYRWRPGARWQGKAQDIGERLDAVRARYGGELTPAAVVADAADPASPLHPNFEWDDARAAHAHRLAQARHIVRDVFVVYAEEVAGAPKAPIRAFVSIAGDEEGEQAAPVYRSLLDAMRSPAQRAEVLERARAELNAWRVRYRHYNELADAVIAVQAIADSIGARGEATVPASPA